MQRLLVAALAAAMSISLFAPPGGATGPDPYGHRQWALGRIAAQDAWSRATGAGMTIAVIDTGVSAFHPEFAGKLHPASASWFSCPGSQVPCTDTSAWNIDGGHGTWVAGVAAASRNGEGIAGVAPDARIMALRAVGFWEEEIPERSGSGRKRSRRACSMWGRPSATPSTAGPTSST